MNKAMKNHEGLCWNCLNTVNHINEIIIKPLGYGSDFDLFGTTIHLCDKCYQESQPHIWSDETIPNPIDAMYSDVYKYETEMSNYINQMPLAGRQFVCNEFATGNVIDPDIWMEWQSKYE